MGYTVLSKMPESPPLPPKYVSYVPSRGYRGKYKHHKTLGHAKAAVTNGGYGIIWEWIDGEWVVLYSVMACTRRENMPWNIEKTVTEKEAARRADAAAARRRAEEYLKEIKSL